MKIQFSKPLIDQNVVDEVNDTLLNSGWLTSGPKVKQFEEQLIKTTGSKDVICVNSWVSGAMVMLRWLGIRQGDEVIIPAYTYSATALAVMNMGGVPVMVDINEDFNINTALIEAKITEKTKAIIPVDMGGWPADYDEIIKIVNAPAIRYLFRAESPVQEKLGRILVISDAAHSIGSIYKNKPAALAADCAIFSFHSVKNITSGEGGAICLNLPVQFDQETIKDIRYLCLNGQTKSAYQKNEPGNWRYDIVDQGLKVNMPDICASIGLAQIRNYKEFLLPERKKIFNYYNAAFQNFNWAILPPDSSDIKESSYHLYTLRIMNIEEAERDKMIMDIAAQGVSVNVHYIPMAMLTLFKRQGYNIEDYPGTYRNYKNEISLPVYNGLTELELQCVIEAVIKAYNNLLR